VERASETLTLDEVVEVNRQQIQMFGGLFLPVNNLHNQASLEFALEAVDGELFDRVLYPSFAEKAASLAWCIITNHVFHDGNKRTAISVCRIFLLLNGFDLEIETETVDQDAMNTAIDVASGAVNQEQLNEWVAERMVPLDD
jgi:death-on-curing protein